MGGFLEVVVLGEMRECVLVWSLCCACIAKKRFSFLYRPRARRGGSFPVDCNVQRLGEVIDPGMGVNENSCGNC